jgi:hypothetical protein
MACSGQLYFTYLPARVRGSPIWTETNSSLHCLHVSMDGFHLLAISFVIFEHKVSETKWYQTSRSSGLHSCFVFGRFRVQISVRWPTVLTQVFVVFLSPPRQVQG